MSKKEQSSIRYTPDVRKKLRELTETREASQAEIVNQSIKLFYMVTTDERYDVIVRNKETGEEGRLVVVT